MNNGKGFLNVIKEGRQFERNLNPHQSSEMNNASSDRGFELAICCMQMNT